MKIGELVIAVVSNLLWTEVIAIAGWGADRAHEGIHQKVIDPCMLRVIKDNGWPADQFSDVRDINVPNSANKKVGLESTGDGVKA